MFEKEEDPVEGPFSDPHMVISLPCVNNDAESQMEDLKCHDNLI